MNVRVSFMTANFVAREVGYHMPGGWGQGDGAAHEFFRPIETYEARFGKMLDEIKALGFEAIDLWAAHCSADWATPDHLRIVRKCVDERGLRIHSFAGGGGDPGSFEKVARMCAELGIPIIGGGCGFMQSDRPALIRILREHGVVFGYENHPEKSAAEVLEKIGEGDEDVFGVAIDTGWLGSQQCDGVETTRSLLGRIKVVHLKDVRAPRVEKTGFQLIDMAHETCSLGDGIVPVREIVSLLEGSGYQGTYSIEHEPEEYDPRAECGASLVLVDEWLR